MTTKRMKKVYWAVCFAGTLDFLEYKNGLPLIYTTKKKASEEWDLVANEQSVIPVTITPLTPPRKKTRL